MAGNGPPVVSADYDLVAASAAAIQSNMALAVSLMI